MQMKSWNVMDAIIQQAKKSPDKIAICERGKTCTYADLLHQVRKVSCGLKKNKGVNDRVVIMSNNCIEYAEVFLGAIYAGCIPVVLDPKWSQKEMIQVLDNNNPSLLFGDKYKLMKIPDKTMQTKISFQEDKDITSYSTWVASQKEDTVMETNEMLFIGYTSGTTGKPKGFMRSHQSWIKSFESGIDIFRFKENDHFIAPGSFAHSLSLFVLIQSLYLGGTFHVVSKFNAEKVAAICNQYKEVILFVVPTMIQSLIESTINEADIKGLISSGSKWTAAMKKQAIKRFGKTKLFEFYGTSEASYISYLTVSEETDLHSAGKPFPGVEISVCNENGWERDRGEVGQLKIKSEMVFTGYDHMPEETKAVFHDGWLLLGDYGYLDENNKLYLSGRKKNMIITGGLNVFPEEVETVLKQLSEIKESMVFGISDMHWGERVVAVVSWKGERKLSSVSLRKYCSEFLATYKIPKKVVTVDSFVYTGGGKVARKVMEDRIKDVLT
ncbi:AMP-binding protein [Lentibacillus cibarius]|uniref:Acyl-CoA synthetase n=1 Tax=Lentibacillus cibarius TaxID=2583219 RepID=A0A5S3QG83_9BACI|nr:AMP-binding protein [Lentibacillus cibarius]TMN20900.1 acyl-CoA synthetase [Lentibacillus cibarius]